MPGGGRSIFFPLCGESRVVMTLDWLQVAGVGGDG